METTEDSFFPPISFKPLLIEISGLLRSTSSTLAVAETTTGGLVSASLLSVSGASKFFVAGATVYTNKSRRVLAGWTDEDVVNYIGPTPELVTELATSVREQMDATYCIGEWGAAGPTVPGPPLVLMRAGQTCISVVSREGFATRVVNTGGTDREKNMVAFAKATLMLLRDVLAGDVELEQRQPDSEGSETTKL